MGIYYGKVFKKLDLMRGEGPFRKNEIGIKCVLGMVLLKVFKYYQFTTKTKC